MTRITDRTANLLGALALGLTDAQAAAARKIAARGDSAVAAIITLGANPGLTIGQLAAILGVTHSVAVRLVEALGEEGLVARRPGADRRAVPLALTDPGAALRTRIRGARGVVLAGALAPLDPAARVALTALLERMLAGWTTDEGVADHLCRLCDEAACRTGTCPLDDAVARART